MENKKIELGVFAAENRKRAADFLNKTTNKVKTALDQNDDGELNLKDIHNCRDPQCLCKRNRCSYKRYCTNEKSGIGIKNASAYFRRKFGRRGFLAAKACPHYRDGQKTCRKRSLQRFCGLFLERKRFEGRQYFPR